MLCLDSIALTRTLTFRRTPGFLTMCSDRVYITQLKKVDEGLVLLAALKDAINTMWEHRHELVAVPTRRRVPRPLDVWSLLPQTNCKQCGEPTCFTFAFQLAASQKKIANCPPLFEPSSAEKLVALQAIVIEAPTIG